MAEQAKATLNLSNFVGMVNAADPQAIPPGASEVQINVMALVNGQLQTRRGYSTVQFADEGD